MSLNDKLNLLKQTKTALKNVINNKGGNLTDSDPFSSYPTAVENLATSSIAGVTVENDILNINTAYNYISLNQQSLLYIYGNTQLDIYKNTYIRGVYDNATVTAENLDPANIKEDVTILGKTGTLKIGVPIEVATAAEMDALLIAENVGKIYKYVGVTDSTYTNNELYQVVEEA